MLVQVADNPHFRDARELFITVENPETPRAALGYYEEKNREMKVIQK